MIIHRGQNALSKMKSPPFEQNINLLSDEIKNYKKNSFGKEIFKKKYIEIRNNNSIKYENKALIPHKKKNHNKLKFKISKNMKANNSNSFGYIDGENIPNQKYLTINTKKASNNNILDENNLIVSKTCRFNKNNKKENYLKNFLKEIIDSSNTNDVNNNYNTSLKAGNNISLKLEKPTQINLKRNNSSYANQLRKNNTNKYSNLKDHNSGYANEIESSDKLKEELDYEFEIRQLEKKLKEVKMENKKLENKLIKIKNNSKVSKQIEVKENIIYKVIDICKNISFSGNSNFFSSFNENNTKIIPSDYSNTFPATKIFKNMLLNLMELKYDCENIFLRNEFFYGIKNIIYNANIFKLNVKEIDIYDIVKNLTKEEIKLKTTIENIKYASIHNKIYYDYFLKLCYSLNIKSLEELDVFLKNMSIKAKVEYNQINQIKNIVLNNNQKNIINLNEMDKKINNNNKIDNKDKKFHQYYFLGPKALIKKSNSESKINSNVNPNFKEQIQNSKFFEYNNVKENCKNNDSLNKSLTTKNIVYRNNYNNFPFKNFMSSHNNLTKKNKKYHSNEGTIYDLTKRNNYKYNIYNYYNNDYNDENVDNSNLKKNTLDAAGHINNFRINSLKNTTKVNEKIKKQNFIDKTNLKKNEISFNNIFKNNINTNKKIYKNNKL